MRYDNTICKSLKTVAYVSQLKKTEKNISGEAIDFLPTFCYNPESKTSHVTAQVWAQERNYKLEWNGTPNPRYVQNDNEVPKTLINEPFEIEIIDLEARGNGGRAYKVIDSEHRLFDLREDQLLDVIKLFGISPGGKIPAKFVWGQLGSQIKLVLVGGKLHQAMTLREQEQLRSEDKQKIITIKGKDLVPGCIYQMKSMDQRLYLGKMIAPFFEKPIYAFKEYYSIQKVYSPGITLVKEPVFQKMLQNVGENVCNEQRKNVEWLESNFQVNSSPEIKKFFLQETGKDFDKHSYDNCYHSFGRKSYKGWYGKNDMHYEGCKNCENDFSKIKKESFERYIKQIIWK
jgi:hypothetical protein